MFTGDAKPDVNVRQDILGGWMEDKVNKFTKKGRIIEENEIFDFEYK